jgi:hypothetical protein
VKLNLEQLSPSPQSYRRRVRRWQRTWRPERLRRHTSHKSRPVDPACEVALLQWRLSHCPMGAPPSLWPPRRRMREIIMFRNFYAGRSNTASCSEPFLNEQIPSRGRSSVTAIEPSARSAPTGFSAIRSGAEPRALRRTARYASKSVSSASPRARVEHVRPRRRGTRQVIGAPACSVGRRRPAVTYRPPNSARSFTARRAAAWRACSFGTTVTSSDWGPPAVVRGETGFGVKQATPRTCSVGVWRAAL